MITNVLPPYGTILWFIVYIQTYREDTGECWRRTGRLTHMLFAVELAIFGLRKHHKQDNITTAPRVPGTTHQ